MAVEINKCIVVLKIQWPLSTDGAQKDHPMYLLFIIFLNWNIKLNSKDKTCALFYFNVISRARNVRTRDKCNNMPRSPLHQHQDFNSVFTDLMNDYLVLLVLLSRRVRGVVLAVGEKRSEWIHTLLPLQIKLVSSLAGFFERTSVSSCSCYRLQWFSESMNSIKMPDVPQVNRTTLQNMF